MLESLRKSATGWVAKILIGLLVISFAIWGISDIFRGFGATTVAKVGETEIPSELFRIAYNNQLRDLGVRMRRPVTAQEAVAAGLPTQVLGRLVNEAVLDEEARRLGLGLSDQVLADEIRSDPNMRGLDGRFSRERFQQILYNSGVSEEFYTVQRRSQNLRAQLSAAVAGGVSVPTAYLEAFNRFRNETRVARYILLDAASVGTIAEPSPEKLAEFFNSRKTAFRAPEYRKFIFVSVAPATLARPGEVADDDIRAAYEAAGTKYVTPEKRAVRQIVFPSPEDADAALRKVRGGASFESIAAERGLSAGDVDLGLITKAEMIDPAVGDIAFGLTKMAVSDVIEGRFGSILVQVTDIRPEQRTPIEEVRDAIAKDVATRLARNDVLRIHDDIEDARAGGATLAEVIDRFDLDGRTIEAVDRSGATPQGQRVELPESDRLLAGVFDSDVGVENDPLHQAHGFIWYDVLGVTPARDRTLEEAADTVLATWSVEERDRRLGARAKALTERMAAGATLETLAGELGVEIAISPELTRSTPADGVAPEIVAAAFDGPEGHVSSVRLGNGGRAVVSVKDVVPPVFFAEAEDVTQMKEQLDAQLTNTVLTQFVARLRDEVGVEINQTTVARAIGIRDLQ